MGDDYGCLHPLHVAIWVSPGLGLCLDPWHAWHNLGNLQATLPLWRWSRRMGCPGCAAHRSLLGDGLACLIAVPDMKHIFPWRIYVWVLIGGLLYTVGIGFFVRGRMEFHL